MTLRASNPNRASLMLVLGTASLGLVWVVFSQYAVPPIIARVYRGESLAVFNRMITGQAFHPLAEYLHDWQRLSWHLLLVLVLAGLLAVVVIRPEVQTFFLGRLAPVPEESPPIEADRFIQKYKLVLLYALIIYFTAAHYWFLGFVSFDGFSYRVPPIIELVQHGSLGGEKFDYPDARHFYPFLELVHVLFLKVLGLPGLYFSFSLVLLPLATVAIYWFVLETTGDRRWATYSAMVYLSLPFVNEQPFSGYIDFAIPGALAFFLLTLVQVLRPGQSTPWSWARFALATGVFSMSRQQAPYVALFLVGPTIAWFFGPWQKQSIRLPVARLRLFLLTFLVGMGPSMYLHILRFLEFGSPIYPYQFKFLGIATRAGLPLETVLSGAGLLAPSVKGMLRSFSRGWLWPSAVPSSFYDSRYLGAGFFLWIALIGFPLIRTKMHRLLAFLCTLLVATSLISREFWLPRYAVSLVLVVVLCVGGGLALLAAQKRRWAYTTLLVVSVLHLVGRPIYTGVGLSVFHLPSFRANFSDSPWFIANAGNPKSILETYPDWGADLYTVYPVRPDLPQSVEPGRASFLLPLYGKHLSNQIMGTLDPTTLGDSCAPLHDLVERSPRRVLIVDETNRLAGRCALICEMPRPWGCLARKLAP